MKVAIVGCRDFTDGKIFCFGVDLIIAREKLDITEIISGGARGVDTMAETYAKENNIPFKCFPAQWEQFGRSAGPIRNKQMVEYSDYIIAFWDGNSRGTKNTIDFAKELNKPIVIIPIDKHLWKDFWGDVNI